jgi:gamma-glutamyltranspeptidase/glutathione hydrolase
MGGHAQAQIHVQIVGALAGQGMDPAAALERPRWSVPFEDPDGDAVDVEDRGSTARALEARGHRVRRVAPFAQEMGHAQVILVDHETGALIGAADPRSDGLALGY